METETLRGTVNSVIYVNQVNRHTILKLQTGDGEITVAGTFADVNPGEILTLRGCFSVHPKYGRQFVSVSYDKELPDNADVIMKYLSSGAIKGIGPVTAKAIVEKFGNETLDIIENHPDKLATVRGVTRAKAQLFSDEFAKQNSARTTIISLIDLGIDAHHAIKIFDAFGEAAVDTVERNPYAIYESVRGFDFPACDALAARLGLPFADLDREIASAAGAPIPEIFAARNRQLLWNQTERGEQMYERAVSKGGRASDCIACGQCEGVCPQHLPIIESLKAVAERFEG